MSSQPNKQLLERRLNANVTLLDLIDLKEPKHLKLKVNGKDMEVVHLTRQDGKLYVMVAGGKLVEVNQETFDTLKVQLQNFFRNHR